MGHIELLAQLAREKTEATALRMRHAQAVLSVAQRQAQQLEVFLLDYQQRLRQGAARGMGIEGWKNFQCFLRRLEEAIAIQHSETSRCLERFLLEKQAWHHERNTLKAFEKLLERAAQRQQRQENRRLQKLNDDIISLSRTRARISAN